MKNILGLDLGTTSIGWAYVKETTDPAISSSIEKIGVRVNPLSTDELSNFEKGKPLSVNADRTLKRSMRRNLQRYKQRRKNLVNVLIKNNLITPETALAENDKKSTHSTYALRAQAASEQVSKANFARILLMINKKRGYKSSRKAKNEEEGQAIDGMAVAKRLYDEQITPGQLCYQLLKEGKTALPDFYRSDLTAEFEKVWNCQKQYYAEIFTDEFKKSLQGKGQRATSASFWGTYQFNTAENKGTREEKKIRSYEWRSKAITAQLSKEEAAYVITEINCNINNSNGYLGAISDRSKELYFKKQTVGQYLYLLLQENPNNSLSNQVFYRQDYLDEFETIWENQAKYHKELTPELKVEIRDIIIFFQRKLKSQKGRVSICEFENKTIEVEKEGKKKSKTIGFKVAPKSSPLFQEFKIWQVLNILEAENKVTKEKRALDQEAKQFIFNELNVKGNLSKDAVVTLLGYKPKEWDLNFVSVEGNRTNKVLYEAFLKILEIEGYDIKSLLQLRADKDDIRLSEIPAPAVEIKNMIRSVFTTMKINGGVLDFVAELEGKEFENQPAYQLWHLLYSYEGDNSYTGNEHLYNLLEKKFGFSRSHAQVLANITLPDDYGNLSAKAIRKIFPHIRENNYSEACRLAGYNHSSSLTKKENANRQLTDKLDPLSKNSLRNPVVEKILNQMVNVVNALIDQYSEKDGNGKITKVFKFDEIRIELARELKKNAEEREQLYLAINKASAEHEKIRQILIKEDGIKNPTRNDIIRYKLYQELKNNGYRTLYSNTYIPREKLFSKEFDIEHIIPKALLFDDSFSNKTICVRQENIDKANKCALEYIESSGNGAIKEFTTRLEMLYQLNFKSPGEGISKSKYKKLLMKAEDLGQGFIERDLRDSQYIAKKAKQMLLEISPTVISTSGSITDRLREDWELVNVMQELNMEKYRRLGLTEMIEKKDGTVKERIKDWSKRNDHRHHAMDALTIAFTRHSHIQYLNHLNARKDADNKMHGVVNKIEEKETYIVSDDTGNKKRKFKMPLPNFREEAKKHIEAVLVSHKAKNKVVTKNKNKFKTAGGEKSKIELTPRGQLHKETVYGKISQYSISEEKVGAKFDKSTIQKVASPKFRSALLQRLEENNNDPKKAFTGKNSLDKNGLFVDDKKTIKVPEKVKIVWLENDFTIRKDVTPENFKDSKNIEKVIDKKTRDILLKRLVEYNGNAKEAFSNLDKNPIWLNKERQIFIKRVTISGVKNAEPLHYKRDHFGRFILDGNGNKQPVNFVSTGNNHHVAIYKDENGELQDNVISLYEAVVRARLGLPVIDKTYNQHLGWQFLFTMKQNEKFLFLPEDLNISGELTNGIDYSIISPYLFRVQKFSKVSYGNASVRDYVFRHHLETSVDNKKELKEVTYKAIKSLSFLHKVIKVRLNHVGQIVRVGEY